MLWGTGIKMIPAHHELMARLIVKIKCFPIVARDTNSMYGV